MKNFLLLFFPLFCLTEIIRNNIIKQKKKACASMKKNNSIETDAYLRYKDLTRSITKHERLYDHWGWKHNVPFSTFMVMEKLLQYPEGGFPSEIADRLYLPRQTMSGTLRNLEKNEYIVRSFHPSDGRRKVIRLTDSGKAYISGLLAQLNQAQMRAYALLTVAEQKQLNYLMERLTDGLETEFEK